MKKFLRFSLVAILALLSNVTFADEAYKTLSFPDENSENNTVSAYNKTWTATIGSDSWSIENFNNNNWKNWTYIKCGSKNFESVAAISTTFAIDKAISNVVVTIDKVTADYVNSIYLQVATDASFTNITETVNATTIEASDLVLQVTNPTAGCYYKVVFDCAQGSSNGIIQVSKVAYYEGAPEIVDITNTPETAYTIAKAKELIDAGEGLSTAVYVKGYITEISEVSTSYGNASYYINDTAGSTDGQLMVYRGYYLDGAKFTSEDQIEVGDEVIVYGTLTLYGTTYEINSGNYIYSINGTTGINNITTEEETVNSNAPIYNLAGQRVSKDTKGILIQNGKKFINK
ncbi:MAG: hypothetical protein Q4D41_11165 [Prevotellaceae bacterium]|nr:hypothetical protein [Prevotellaceae bacterium]